MKIFRFLEKSPVVRKYDVLDFRLFSSGFYLKIRAEIVDGSVLFIREYVDEKERNYSYHWQTGRGEILVRWDNAPHHLGLRTYPHHKHIGGDVLESFENTCEDVLCYIGDHLKK